MALIDDPGTSMMAFFAGRDAYLKALNEIEGAPGDLTLDDLGDDMIGALMACVEAATPSLRAQGIQMALNAMEQGLRALHVPEQDEAARAMNRVLAEAMEFSARIRAEIAPGGTAT